MSFRSVFIAVTVAFALILAAFLVNRARPKVDTEQPTADFVRASGKCAECHARLQYSVVHEYEMSEHAKKGVNCLTGLPSTGNGATIKRTSWIHDQHKADRGQLPQLPRGHIPGVSAQPSRSAELGRHLWRKKGLNARTSGFQ